MHGTTNLKLLRCLFIVLNEPGKYAEMCFSNVWGSDERSILILWTIRVGNHAKFEKRKKKQHIRNRVKICGKLFIPENLFFHPPYDHGYDFFSF